MLFACIWQFLAIFRPRNLPGKLRALSHAYIPFLEKINSVVGGPT